MPEEKYKIGQRVRLIPSQGVYQKPLNGTIISLTRTQVGVRVEGTAGEKRFRKDDGMPVRRYDREFPCYVLKPIEQKDAS